MGFTAHPRGRASSGQRARGQGLVQVSLQEKAGLEWPREELGAKLGNHLCKQRGLLPRVTEGVNVPGHTGAPIFAKRVFQEAQPKCHLVYDGSVVGGCLIVHHPATVGKLQASCARKGKICGLSGPGLGPGVAIQGI